MAKHTTQKVSVLTFLHAGKKIGMLFGSLLIFKNNSPKKYFSNTIILSKSLDTDQT